MGKAWRHESDKYDAITDQTYTQTDLVSTPPARVIKTNMAQNARRKKRDRNSAELWKAVIQLMKVNLHE